MRKNFLHLFKGYGIELEYAIVDKVTLNVRPIADWLLAEFGADESGEVNLGKVSISNELANHLVELKTTHPVKSIDAVLSHFYKIIQKLNQALAKVEAVLMPTSCHPWMDPVCDTELWPRDPERIYQTYDRIFDCRGHGWLNLQSVHLNLPFYDNAEFGKLHAAIRLVLPLIPALAASSPLLNGEPAGMIDARLDVYFKNQNKIPVIAGHIIPEAIFDLAQYDHAILQKIYNDLEPHDPDRILQDDWVNSRGAILRMERQTIEIRLMDIQEAPCVDLAILSFFVAAIRLLVDEYWVKLRTQKLFSEKSLLPILLSTVKAGGEAEIDNEFYLSIFNYPGRKCLAKELLGYLADVVEAEHGCDVGIVRMIISNGTLSERILKALDNDYSHQNIKIIYAKLTACLAEDKQFL